MKRILRNILLSVVLAIIVQSNGESLPESVAKSDAEPSAVASPVPQAVSYSDPYANALASPSAYPNAYPYADANPGLISDMLDRGKALVHQFMPTGLTIANVVKNFIPTPSNIFRLGKHLVFELPQEIVLYAVQEFCK